MALPTSTLGHHRRYLQKNVLLESIDESVLAMEANEGLLMMSQFEKSNSKNLG